MKTKKTILLQTLLIFTFFLAAMLKVYGQQSTYGNFPYEQSFLTKIQPSEISKPTASGTNVAAFTTDGLMLTDKVSQQFGAIFVNDRKFNSLNGIVIEFEYMVYGGTNADGFSVFFFDANVENPHIGSKGAAIGYTYNRALMRHYPAERRQGLSGGYLGIAFDSYGNFKATRFLNEEIVAGIGIKKPGTSHITLRGAKGAPYAPSGTTFNGMGDGYTGYPVLITQSTNTNEGSAILNENGDYVFNFNPAYSGNFNLRGGAVFENGDVNNPAYRKAIIELFPMDDNDGMVVTVKIQHGKEITIVIDDYEYRSVTKYRETAIVSDLSGDNIYGQIDENSTPIISNVLDLQSKIPDFVRIGFAGATGMYNDIHMIKNLNITLPGAAEANDDSVKIRTIAPVTIYPLLNDYGYEGKIMRDQQKSPEHINPATFSFLDNDGNIVSNPYTTNEGTWEYNASNGIVIFTPNANFIDNANIKYEVYGNKTTAIPYSDPAYRSLPATISVILDNTPNPTRNTISNKMVTIKLNN